ncbi:type VI secretion system protein ImpH [Pseudoduganella lurida]|uniref:Type VI secretion system protein ImpH n=1 Tax=Pseudoduganella lurida TaxID=1036180 RepID=A0A562RLS9_9BURK|nr:type VI secretion system baseplate subunit TssG [Pseudoduganella lurida]TWI69400.1 type VI secretion system protein ImpH [Pseudoduganella lurida]
MRDPVALEAALERDAARMEFFQVLRLIEAAHPQLPRIGTSLRPRDDAVRFGQHASMTFNGTQLAAFRRSDGAARGRLAVNFLGLLGANGPLPLHLTEYVRDRLRNGGDGTLLAFLDVFHHRLLSLFYRARAQAEPAISLDRPEGDRFADYVGSLFGIGSPALRGRDAIGDFARLHFAGLLASHARPAAGLVAILRAYFGLPVRIEQFAGHWLRLPEEVRTRLGGAAAGADGGNALGISTVLGKSVWDCQSRFRLVLGPMALDDYRRLLPGGASMARLLAWVREYAGLALDWDVRLVLRREDTPPLRLGRGLRLGWTTWPHGAPPDRDRDQLLVRPLDDTFIPCTGRPCAAPLPPGAHPG